MKTLRHSDWGDALGVTRADTENWIRRPEVTLRTRLLPTVPGRARVYTKDNVTEFALIGALSKIGCPIDDGAAWAEVIMDEARRPSGGQGEYLVFPAKDFGNGGVVNELVPNQLSALHDASPNLAIVSIRVGAILRKVDQLFQDAGTKTGN
ncbi:hypothetical protein [Tropicimonas sp. IMCC6043]|uniref:hypothetical protein n=1 Tax=Tropicimonas sp. IMCC6043 TaxID=2510645 RepID=UPI00101B9033|nr:hypothetical protein [Tropicimonas sp. IMCC6043]RYH06240.1 hypothetical protein EU800_24520 [Tropicimonas sp. IMCC6043]